MAINDYDFGGMLSKLERPERYAACHKCKTIYRDDAPQWGSLKCPRCGLALERGITRKNACNLLKDGLKELLA